MLGDVFKPLSNALGYVVGFGVIIAVGAMFILLIVFAYKLLQEVAFALIGVFPAVWGVLRPVIGFVWDVAPVLAIIYIAIELKRANDNIVSVAGRVEKLNKVDAGIR